MANKTCDKCGKVFDLPCRLQAHSRRKTPCDVIVSPAPTKPYTCTQCGRNFASRQGLSRHKKEACKIVRDDKARGGLQEQLVQQNEKIDKLTKLVEQIIERPTISHTNNMNNTNNIAVVNIHPWDSGRPITLDMGQIAAAFTENTRLREYAGMSDADMATRAIGLPYVIDLLMDLTKRAHEDPAGRNVYLSPNRADQVLAWMKDGHWEVLPLQTVTRTILDDVSGWMHVAALSQEMEQSLPMDARKALAIAGLLYNEEPDHYAIKAKGPMVAHLTNCREKILRDDTQAYLEFES
jgi:hypothetical protein